jgi:hypothetical protein
MKKTHIKMFIVAAIMITAFLATGLAMADPVTFTGKVTEDFQIVDNAGQSYDVAENPVGDEMVSQAAGKTVQVTGTVQEEGGVKTITVESYKIME